ncbi:MAG: hypothetical protein IJS28_01410 [Synergistaceae bacterium]|nr:hypothetical protein [Synergistaceae bacterium]
MTAALIAGQGILPTEIAERLCGLQDGTLILALRYAPEELAHYASRHRTQNCCVR